MKELIEETLERLNLAINKFEQKKQKTENETIKNKILKILDILYSCRQDLEDLLEQFNNENDSQQSIFIGKIK